jgi:hypothetical protein
MSIKTISKRELLEDFKRLVKLHGLTAESTVYVMKGPKGVMDFTLYDESNILYQRMSAKELADILRK